MSRLLSRLALGILILILWLPHPDPANAQQTDENNRVVSVVEDSADKFLLLNTAAVKPLPPPTIQYLPGADRGTILVADFPGLIWDRPVQVFFPHVPGIRLVRVGQLQGQRPVCRISIATSQPELLRQLAFLARPGALILKWPVE